MNFSFFVPFRYDFARILPLIDSFDFVCRTPIQILFPPRFYYFPFFYKLTRFYFLISFFNPYLFDNVLCLKIIYTYPWFNEIFSYLESSSHLFLPPFPWELMTTLWLKNTVLHNPNVNALHNYHMTQVHYALLAYTPFSGTELLSNVKNVSTVNFIIYKQRNAWYAQN